MVHLHVKSHYSFRRAASSPDALVAQALKNGDHAIAITDFMSVAGCIPLQVAAQAVGIKAIIGAEIKLEGYPLVFLAASQTGYATINRLISRGFERKDEQIGWDDLREAHEDVFILTAGRDGYLRHLLEQNQPHSALEFVRTLEGINPKRVLIEVSSHQRPGEARIVRKLLSLSQTSRIPALVSNDVHYATPNEALRQDVLVLSRHRLTVNDDQPERLWTQEAWLKPRSQLEALIYGSRLYQNTLELARECSVDLLPKRIEVPRANLSLSSDPNLELEILARAGIKQRYPSQKRLDALKKLEGELEIIKELGLAEFFLVVHEVIAQAKIMGIRTAGRGSAASSIVVFALGIAHADPLAFRLRFERFLNPGRFAGGREAPDIDVDVQSSRRQELINWVTDRFAGRTAMAANINVYGIRGATRDVARVLGWTHDVAGAMTKVLPRHSRPKHIAQHRAVLEAVVGESPLLEVLIRVTAQLDDTPRDLGLHSGGMLLARDSIYDHTATKRSANGTLQGFLDKRTAEANGLVKLDLLGLLILDVLDTTLELLKQDGMELNLEQVNLDDPRIYAALKDGKVVGLFQIESPAQQALIAQLQPTCFLDLVAQVALIRPGPIQAQSVKPYIKRRNGREKVSYLHWSLEPILKQTYGLMVFQDQAIEVAQVICGMTVSEADRFRKLISKARDRDDMEAMRSEFLRRALETHDDLKLELATQIFEVIAGFSGYGFPLSHSCAFAITAAYTAYLKALYPSHFLAAVLEHEPGMYPRLTIAEEAKRLKIPLLPVSLELSGVQFQLEPQGQQAAIRMSFAAVHGVSEDAARLIVLERLSAPFSSLEDFYSRVSLNKDMLEHLAQAGAFETFGARRDVLWQLGILANTKPARDDQAPLFRRSTISPEDLAWLEHLSEAEAITWDLEETQTSQTHPMGLMRSRLEAVGVKRIGQIADGMRYTIAGVLPVGPQRPETAKGVVFLLLEDESGHCQGIVSAELWEDLRAVFRSRALLLTGRVQRLRGWKTMVVESAASLEVVMARETGKGYAVR
jgi:error-prone DNA polymerase